MDKLNGYWQFYYSEEQAKERDFKSCVKVDGEWKEYTEGTHLAHTQRDGYKPHKTRYEDSEKVAGVDNPRVKGEKKTKE